MDCHLNLIKTDFQQTEKRIFPRFPFSYLNFKSQGNSAEPVFEVLDISYLGMQLNLRDGSHRHRQGETLVGQLHSRQSVIDISGIIKWVKGGGIGVSFESDEATQAALDKFLSLENMVKEIRMFHHAPLGAGIPANLVCWLRSSGPLEIFVWQHSDREISKFQVMVMDSLVEWRDGHGLRSGQVTGKSGQDSPLYCQDEYQFKIDSVVNQDKLKMAQTVIGNIPMDYMGDSVYSFVQLKLGE
ncbi:MAG: hypothetical protein HN353_00350 [Bdellovibrionales bacterium]|jgi:hypothetical protein|nr:hypothetical protein [Bdellovibrionales bacterium]MBT3526416.1 hypothetical protein [Bdellovibrionales bacterium]MBT7768136.1 hypothetical protein [Bdellovibrionales bacterium]